MIQRFRIVVLGVLLSAGLAACQAGTQEKDENQVEKPYRDYQVNGDEDWGEITVRLQFRRRGPEGAVLPFDSAVSVLVDDMELKADSSRMNGVYYEAIFEAAGFGGLHRIGIRMPGEAPETDSFYFPFFWLEKELPATVSRNKDLEMSIGGLDEKDGLHIMLTDTSFYGKGIDRLDSVAGGRLLVSSRDLGSLRNGPIQLVFYREKEKELSPGRLYLSYNLSREFQLTD